MEEIRKYFKNIDKGICSNRCPDDEALFRFANELIEDEESESLREKILSCDSCIEKVALIKKSQDENDIQTEETPPQLKKRLKGILKRNRKMQNGKMGNRKRHLWFLFFVVAMVLSFTWKAYYQQMLVIALVCAGKWLLETRARYMKIDVHHKGTGLGQGSRDRSRSIQGSPIDQDE